MKTNKAFALSLVCVLAMAVTACGPANPATTTPSVEPGVSPLPPSDVPHPVLDAQLWLAAQMNVPLEQITIVSMEHSEWSDSCLGLGQANESCAQVITPGWRVMFRVNGQQIEVRTNDSASTIRMAAPTAQNPLVGSHWKLVSYGPTGSETLVVKGSNITLEFESEGQVGGSGGCNSYGGEYQLTGNTLTFGAIMSTKMACVDETLMNQEQQYFEALQNVNEFELTGDQLILLYDDGRGTLTFAQEPTVSN